MILCLYSKSTSIWPLFNDKSNDLRLNLYLTILRILLEYTLDFKI